MRTSQAPEGLLHALLLDGSGGARALNWEDINSWTPEQLSTGDVLSMVAAIFLPLGFFTGLMDINVGGMPGVEDNGAFWVVGLCVAVMLVLAALFRWKRWL
jgi:zinc transporter